MAVNRVDAARNLSAVTDRYASPAIWADCPLAALREDPTLGVIFESDFTNISDHITDQSVQEFDSYIDTGVTISQLAGVEGGQLEIAGNDADNDEGVISGHGPCVNIQDAKANKKLWFEGRVKKASIADNALAMFLGIGFDHGNGVPVSKTLCLTDNAGALGAFSFLGFHTDQADGDALDFVYKADGQSAQVAGAGVHTWVAATFVKVGFVYDPDAPAANRIKCFVNNQEKTDYITEANIAAATFPDNEPMTFVWATKVGTGSAEVKAQLDWFRLVQLY